MNRIIPLPVENRNPESQGLREWLRRFVDHHVLAEEPWDWTPGIGDHPREPVALER